MKQMLADAGTQTIAYDHRSTTAYQHELIDELRRKLGLRVDSTEKWYSNFMADFYKGTLDGREVLLKIVVGKVADRADAQFAALEELHVMGRAAGFAVPEPLHLERGRAAYVMGFARGTPMARALLDPRRVRSNDIERSVRLCGSALAEIHNRWVDAEDAASVTSMMDDLKDGTPWRQTEGERRVLDAARQRWQGRTTLTSRLYTDFDPVNVLIDDTGSPVLIDPPEEEVRGPWHWDVGSFTLGMSRSWWRSPWVLPLIAGTNTKLRDAFLEAYAKVRGFPIKEEDQMLIRIAERIRLGQLSLFWRTPGVYRHGLKSQVRDLYSRPLIYSTQKRQIKQLRALVRRERP